MRRRVFIALVGGATCAWPLASRAQVRAPRIGALHVGNPEPNWRLFRDALQALGYIDGKTAHIEMRTAGGDTGKLPDLAKDFVRSKVDLIVAFQTPAVQAAKQATQSLPIVMATAGDPVATGLIASLARPGGNITGMASATSELGSKTLEVLRDLLPKARRIAVLANATDPFTTPFLQHLERGGGAVALEVRAWKVSDAGEFDAAFAAMRQWQAEAMIHQPSLPRARAIDLALQHRLPSISPTRAYSETGGLMSYAADLAAQMHQAAMYVDRILKGARPADLPVQQPTKFELVINLRTAKALGITIPSSLLARADEVIE
ncbi:MAG: ABC transporter substrate-binding protein [Alphaproteobacteria bacterium]|nr:ABC transporter substrate-binding protein [Alphaproteobacteria bacterium]